MVQTSSLRWLDLTTNSCTGGVDVEEEMKAE